MVDDYNYINSITFNIRTLFHKTFFLICPVENVLCLVNPCISWAIKLLHSHDTYTTMNIYMWKLSQHNNDERIHFFRKIYLSHFILERVAKELCVRGELKTEQTATYWPPVLLPLAALLSRSVGLLTRGSWGPIALCWELVLSTASYLQLTDSKLTELPVAPGYIIVWHQPASCERHICTQFNPSTVKVIPWYLKADAPVPRLTAGSMVNMLQNVVIAITI